MPVSVVCESAAANVNAAIRDSLGNSSFVGSSGGSGNQSSLGGHHHHHNHHEESIQNKLVASAKRVLLTKIEYEEVQNYNQSVLDTLKSKYIVLKPTPPTQLLSGNSGKLMHVPATTTTSSSTTTSMMNGSDKDSNQSPAAAATAHNNSTCSSTATSEKSQRNSNELPQPKRILFPRENVQIGWKSSNRKWHVGAGMMNVGNTCYLNSTLQALFHVPAIANWLVSDTAHMERCEEENGTQGGCIICAMSKTLISSQQQQSPIRPYLVYSKLKSICKHLIMGRQEDAHEFLRYLVEAMEKAYLLRFRNHKDLDQFSKETTPPNQILGGYLKSAVRCLACGHVSTTFQHFEDLLLDIRKADTIDEALEGYFSRERLEDMGYKCESCKKKVSATKQFSLERAPIALCIQLKRFSMLGTKLNKQITIRPRLDLSRFASRKNGEQLAYKLVAMVTHLGASQHCGHYTAIGLTESGTYYSFDDSCVRQISVQSVVNTNAYIIFYELETGQHNGQTTSNNRPSTQVNGNHEQSKENNPKNGVGYNSNGSNNDHRQSFYGTTSASPKLISKLNSEQKMIGPQLPDYYKNGSNNGGLSNGFPGNGNKLVNSPSKLSNRPSSLPTSSSKIMIHFKNSAAMMNGNSTAAPATTTTACCSSATASAATSSTDKMKAAAAHESDSEADDDKVTTTSCKQTINNEVSSTTATTTLPSMPKLGLGSPLHIKEKSTVNRQQPVLSTTAPSSGVATSTTNTNGGQIKSPLKSLVPYESESEDDSTDKEHGDEAKTLSITITSATSTSKPPKKKKKKAEIDSLFKRRTPCTTNGNETDNCAVSSGLDNKSSPKKSKSPLDSDIEAILNELGDSSHDSVKSSTSADDLKQAQSTPPSPPVIKTKTGLWQVTNVRPTGNDTSTTPEKKYRNPFATERSATPASRPAKQHSNVNSKPSNGFQPKTDEERNEVVNELMKQSHRGYGAPVLSWNGNKTQLEKEIVEESRLQRKREWEEDDENEMDRGRQKKVKAHKPPPSNPSYNQFQEQQSQQNHYQRRWQLSNNAVNHRYQNTSNGHYRMANTFNRKVNNFKRFGNKFHQRSHQQRSNGGDFHRRDS